MMNMVLSIALAISTWSDPLSVFAPTEDRQPRPKKVDDQLALDQTTGTRPGHA
jgi:hypothetical protein